MAIGSNEQYAAGPFKANDLIVNNQAMFSNPGMMALVAKEARKGTSGFFEIPNKERAEAPFLTAAKERVNQDLGLSPAVQGGMKNFLGESETVEDAPKNWKSSPDSPATELAYITDAEKKLLLDANLHDSLGDGMPNQGPSGIISLDGMGAYDSDSVVSQSQQQQYEQATSGSQGGSGGTSQSQYDGPNAATIPTIFQEQYDAEQNISGGTNNPTDTNFGQEMGVQTGISDGSGEDNLLSQIDQDQRIINELETNERLKFEKLNSLSDEDFERLSGEEKSIFDELNSKYGADNTKLFKDLRKTLGSDFEDGKSGVIEASTNTIKKVAKDFGVSIEQVKDALKMAGKKGLTVPSAIASVMKAMLDKIKYPTEDSFKDNNYLAIMQNKYLNADGSVKKGREKDFERFSTAYSDLIPTMGASNTQQKNFSMKDMLMSAKIGDNTDLERRLNPSKYYEDNPLPQTMGGLEELGQLNLQDFAGNPDFQNRIIQAREASKKDNNLNAYKGEGYQGPVIEKDIANQTFQPMPETPAIDPAVGTRDFASGQTYELPTDYRAALTRDGEYGINNDPLSIAYTGGFNQMEDMDEYLKRIGRKRKNYLDADGNPIMTNAMGGL